jgi:hypothetical protein
MDIRALVVQKITVYGLNILHCHLAGFKDVCDEIFFSLANHSYNVPQNASINSAAHLKNIKFSSSLLYSYSFLLLFA